MPYEFLPRTAEIFKNIVRDPNTQPYLHKLSEYHKRTYEHSVRVCGLSIHLGLENKHTFYDILSLGHAGILHDLGKLHVPLEVLAKQGPLTQEEKQMMMGHPRLSFLELQDFPYEAVREIVIAHHEYKRVAYPRAQEDRREADRRSIDRRVASLGAYEEGSDPRIPTKRRLKKRRTGERRTPNPKIEPLAQIVAVADIVDALATERAYKPALPYEEIEEHLREEFTGDPKYTEQVLRLVKANP